jgi:hypothetical protein
MSEPESPLVPDCSTNDHRPSGNSTTTNGVDIRHHLTTKRKPPALPGDSQRLTVPVCGSLWAGCR